MKNDKAISGSGWTNLDLQNFMVKKDVRWKMRNEMRFRETAQRVESALNRQDRAPPTKVPVFSTSFHKKQGDGLGE